MSDAGFPRPFGRYTLLASLGRGGMGEVFAATSGGIAGIEKRCVVKTLHPSLSADREYVTRFLDEARVAVHLNQRNICSVFEVGVVDGMHYLAMDMVRGRDLRTVWKGAQQLGRPVEQGVVLHIVSEVLDGLHYAHTLTDPTGQPLHIVHRDVSPQNVMVSFDGDVKLIDFGLAASAVKLEKTETNVVMGKVAYMPPEQVRGERADARADVFAAGVMLYELLAGERFYEDVPQLMVSGVVAGGMHRPRRLDQIEVGLQEILLRAIDPVRERRTATAGLFAEDLRAHAAKSGLRGDATGVKRLMAELFSNAREPWEGSSSGSVSSLPVREAVAADSTVPVPPSAVAALSPVEATASSASQSGTAQTQVVRERPALRAKKRWVAAAAAAVVVVIGIAVASSTSTKPTGPVGTAIAPGVQDAGATAANAVDVVDAGVIASVALVDAGTLAAPPAAPPAAQPAVPHDPRLAQREERLERRSQREQERVARREQKSRLPKKPELAMEAATILLKRCKQPCVAPLKRDAADRRVFAQWESDVWDCWARCE